MNLGIFSVSMPDYEPMEAMEVMAKLGYNGVEFRCCEDNGDRNAPSFWSGNRSSMTADEVIEQADALKAKATELNLAMPSLGTYIQMGTSDAEIERHMEATAALGATNLRIGPGGFTAEGSPSYPEKMKDAAVRYGEIAKLADKHGVRSVIETHMGQLAPSISKAMNILRDLDPKHVGIMWDPGNQCFEGLEKIEMAIEEAGDYLAEVHVKNMRWQPGEVVDGQQTFTPDWCPIHEGLVNWPQVVKILTESGYEGWYFFEDFSTVTPLLERLEQNLKFFRSFEG
ncbi:MAG: sugar phosphate isomerase/epimerase family protein [Planctomycetota bacterium]